ncbi:MAG: hypothetical protein Q4Q17_04710 [Tissierellia bacterium]|nr:hypothetical protein [Tissierellia bacterium]
MMFALILVFSIGCKKDEPQANIQRKEIVGDITSIEDEKLYVHESIVLNALMEEDQKKIKELNLTSEDMPSGIYHEQTGEKYEFTIGEKTTFILIDTRDNFDHNPENKEYKTHSIEDLRKHLLNPKTGEIATYPFLFIIDESTNEIIEAREIFVN